MLQANQTHSNAAPLVTAAEQGAIVVLPQPEATIDVDA